MQKLEILQQFEKLYGKQINPELVSLKYCQTVKKAVAELTYKDGKIDTIDLDFIVDDYEKDDEGNIIEIPDFDPQKDIVDNATKFIQFDSYSLINCISGLFSKEAEIIINDEFNRK